MPKRRIVYTRHDGGVSICAPSLTALAYMTGGGGRWTDADAWRTATAFVDYDLRTAHGLAFVETWARGRGATDGAREYLIEAHYDKLIGDGYGSRAFIDRQIAKQAEECGEWAAARFVRAMQFGGITTAEAYGVMRDRFCAHLGTGCELWDVEDVPTDRTYRNAWRRSHNGGPIWIDQRKAIEIDERKAWQAYEALRARG